MTTGGGAPVERRPVVGADPPEAAALLRQEDAAIAPLEQGDTEIFFQGMDLPADRRLGEADLLGRAGEAFQPRRCLERNEGAQGRQLPAQSFHNFSSWNEADFSLDSAPEKENT